MLAEVAEAGEVKVSMIARKFPRFYDFALVVTGVAERADLTSTTRVSSNVKIAIEAHFTKLISNHDETFSNSSFRW